jgi:hypothetical protein
VARWAAPRLDREARVRLRERCRQAVRALGDEVHPAPASAGLPGPAQRRALLSVLEEELWHLL